MQLIVHNLLEMMGIKIKINVVVFILCPKRRAFVEKLIENFIIIEIEKNENWNFSKKVDFFRKKVYGEKYLILLYSS